MTNPRSFTKHSVILRNRKTSVSLEPEFWEALREHASANNTTIGALVTAIEAAAKGRPNLSSNIRVYLFDRATKEAARWRT